MNSIIPLEESGVFYFTMKIERRQEIIVIKEDNAEVFQDRVNSALLELARQDISPNLTIDTNPFVAVMQFERTEYIAESAADRDEIKGLKFKCKNCQFFEQDVERRFGFCTLKNKKVYADVKACKCAKGGSEDDR